MDKELRTELAIYRGYERRLHAKLVREIELLVEPHFHKVSSNDYLRFGHSREYGQPYDEVDEGPGDETTTDNVNELVNRANKHTTISRCVVFLIKASRGEIDQTFRQISKDRVVDRLNLGASEDELKDCALLHLEASTRCLDKVRSLTGVL